MAPGFFVEQAAAPSPPLHLVEEINHRVMNEYAEAISCLSLVARSSSSEAREAIARAAERLRAHAETHRALMPPATRDPVDLADYIGKLCASLSAASLADNGVQITLATEEIRVGAQKAWRIGLIVTELVRNACRHGLGGGAGAIAVRLEERAGFIRCLVVDSGRGDPEALPGRGRRLVQSIAADLGGIVSWSFSPTGSLARLEIPLADPVMA